MKAYMVGWNTVQLREGAKVLGFIVLRPEVQVHLSQPLSAKQIEELDEILKREVSVSETGPKYHWERGCYGAYRKSSYLEAVAEGLDECERCAARRLRRASREVGELEPV